MTIDEIFELNPGAVISITQNLGRDIGLFRFVGVVGDKYIETCPLDGELKVMWMYPKTYVIHGHIKIDRPTPDQIGPELERARQIVSVLEPLENLVAP
jgi:hypothetical protein